MKEVIKKIYYFIRGIFLYAIIGKPANGVELNNTESILVIRTDRIGDLVLSVPFFRGLRKRFPNARIDVLVKKPYAGLIKNDPSINSVIVYKGFLETLFALKNKYDMAIDMINDDKLLPSVLAHYSAKVVSVGYAVAGKGILFRLPVPEPRERKHFIDQTNDILKALGGNIDDNDKMPKLYFDPLTENKLDEFYKSNNLGGNYLIITIHPGGYYPSQRWGAEKYAKLINLILQNIPKAKICLLGSSSEKGLIENIHGMIDEKHKSDILDMAGETLDVIAAIIKKSGLFIGNNSGLLHVATAVSTPTVSVMGPTVPWLWWPSGDKSRNTVVYKGAVCAPCNRGECSSHECLNAITVDEVLQAVLKMAKSVKITVID